jgi:uncharacterized membrane protein YdjX (TVP38/TMEM64 family)
MRLWQSCIHSPNRVSNGYPLASCSSLNTNIMRMSVAELFNNWVTPCADGGLQGFTLTVLVGWLLVACFFPLTPVVFATGFLLGLSHGWLALQLILTLSLLHGLFIGEKLWQYLSNFGFAKNKYLEAIRKAIEGDGLYIVALLRMTPFLHFPTGNLFFGTLDINRFRYVIYSLIGMLPGTTLILYAGSIANSMVVSTESVQLQQWVLLGCGIAIFFFVGWLMAKRMGRHLRAAED